MTKIVEGLPQGAPTFPNRPTRDCTRQTTLANLLDTVYQCLPVSIRHTVGDVNLLQIFHLKITETFPSTYGKSSITKKKMKLQKFANEFKF